MSEPTKHLILCRDFTDYERYIRERRLPASRCFQCLSRAEAYATVARNAKWDITCEIHRTPEFELGESDE